VVMKASAVVFEIVSWPESAAVHYATPGEHETWCGEQIGANATWRPDQGDGELCDACWQVRQGVGGDGE